MKSDAETANSEMSELSPQDALIATALLEGKTQAVAAAEAGCSERTVSRRLAEPAFRSALQVLSVRRLEERGRLVSQASLEGIQVLRELATDRKTADSVRVAAARSLITLVPPADSGSGHLTDGGTCAACGHEDVDLIGLRERARERILSYKR